MSKTKPGLFAREATGLVREVGFMLGVIIIMSHVVGLGWQKRAFQFTGPRPVPTDMLPLGLPAIFWAFLICGIIVMITGYAAGYVTAAMPRSGGGYVTISRVIHPVVGYNAGWLMFLAEAFSYGLIGVAVFEAIMIFYNIALAPTVIAFDATTLFLGGVLIIIIFTALALFGVRLYGWIMHGMFWPTLIITVAFFGMWIAGAMDPSIVATGVEDVMGAPPSTFVTLAIDTGMADPANVATFYDAFSYALAGAFWAYMGWYSVTFIAGEVKEANKKLPMVVLSSGLIIMLIYLGSSSLSAISTMGVAETTVGGNQWSFFQAYSWLSYGPDAAKEAAATIPNFQAAWSTGIASLIARGMDLAWLSWIIALAGVIWLANDIPPFLLVASRTMFAMSFDRMMPEKLAEVSERWHSPIWALIITGVFGIVGCVAESNVADLGGYVQFAGVVGTDIFDATFLTLFCVSMMLLPLERKEIYDRAAVKYSIGSVVGLGFIATLLSGYCLFTFAKESVGFMFSPGSTEDLVSSIGFWGCIIVGLVLYVAYMYRNTTKGVDMRTLYLSIPPE
ncbi:MAG: APC family permease [Candidatus Bathyarchaeota archaeon]|jgi:APA family basic amino acid/polyamine antiporter|nr:APC family permease [Candidatus Bathyarchaeota archaeon]